MTSRNGRIFVALGAAGALIAYVAWRGGVIDRTTSMKLDAAPFLGYFDPRFTSATVVALAVGAAVAVFGDRVADRLPFGRLLIAVIATSAVWGLALAAIDGRTGWTMGLETPTGYLPVVGGIDGIADFVDTFVERLDGYTVHVKGHPPGIVVALWALDAAGVPTSVILAAVVVLASTVGATTLVAARAIAGEAFARRAAPFLAITPAAIWLFSSWDAVFAAVGCAGIAAFAVASVRRGPSAHVLASVAGVSLGYGLYLSYGFVLLGLIVVAIAAHRRAWRTTLIAGTAVVAVVVVFTVAGFSWLEGLEATRIAYREGIASVRPYSYFVLANIAVLAVMIGPAGVAGVVSLRDRRAWVIVAPAIAAVLLADLSGLSKGEVERIWLPFFPWLAVAAATLDAGRRWWLGVQAVIVVAMHSLIFFGW